MHKKSHTENQQTRRDKEQMSAALSFVEIVGESDFVLKVQVEKWYGMEDSNKMNDFNFLSSRKFTKKKWRDQDLGFFAGQDAEKARQDMLNNMNLGLQG